MNENIIWVTGTSASGKTSVIRRLLEKFPEGQVLSDAREMLILNEEDVDHQHHIHPDGGEGFFLTSSYHFDKSVTRIAKKLSNVYEDKLAIVEIARGQGDLKHIDLSYRRFLELVPSCIFEKSVVIYTQASWETRFSRNMERRTTSHARNVERQSFYVPTDAMEGYFRTDDFEQAKESFLCPVFVIDNENSSEEELSLQVDNIVNHLC